MLKLLLVVLAAVPARAACVLEECPKPGSPHDGILASAALWLLAAIIPGLAWALARRRRR